MANIKWRHVIKIRHIITKTHEGPSYQKGGNWWGAKSLV